MNVRLGATLLVGFLGLAHGTALAQGKPSSAVKKFKFKAGKIETGRIYTYDRFDPAGARAGSVLVYVPDRKRVEIFRVKAGAGEGQLFTGEMNWETFTLRSFELSRVSRDGTTTRQATGTFGADTLAVSVEDPSLYRGAEGAATFSVPLPAIPAHLYSLDLITLGLALRHVADSAGSVEVGVLTENAKVGPQSPNLFIAAGTATVEFVEDVARDGVPCGKYRVSGTALGGQEGYVWLHKEEGYLQDAEIPVSPTPDLPDVTITLRSVEKLSEKAWLARRLLEISGGAK
ncbi:MAG: hypothetical protein ACYDBY_01425 [Thermoanaerobaculia bacterium]